MGAGHCRIVEANSGGPYVRWRSKKEQEKPSVNQNGFYMFFPPYYVPLA